MVNKSSDKTENCVNAEKAQDSTNVTTTINGKQISDIFEEDGVTVKKSTNSEHSVLADNATRTSFTNKTFQSGSANNITLTEAGIYQFCGSGTNYPNFGLVYWNGAGSACSAVASTLTGDGEATKYLLKISESGKIVIYYEEISGFESTNIINISDSWIEEDQDFYLYYRKID